MKANDRKQHETDGHRSGARGRDIRITIDAGAQRWMLVIAILLAVVAVGLWGPSASLTSPAAAGPAKGIEFGRHDSGAQRKAMIAELAKVNGELAKVSGTLEKILLSLASGQVKVQVVSDEESEGKSHAAPAKTKK